jgi:NitT/TauT family transport system substrate-binding protein
MTPAFRCISPWSSSPRTDRKTSRGHLFGRLATIAALLLGAQVPAYAQPAQPRRVIVSEVSRSLINLPAYIGVQKGFFQSQGLNVEIVTSGRRDLSTLSLISGETQFSGLDPAEPAMARLKGAKMKVVAPVIVNLPIYVVIPDTSGIRSIEDLKGKTIATATAPTTSYSTLQALLASHGFVEVSKDQWRPAGSTAAADNVNIVQVAVGNEIAVVKAGRADAANVYPPFEAVAQKTMNAKILYRYSTQGAFFFTGMSVLEDSIRRDRDMVQRFVNGMTMVYCFMSKHPDESAKLAEQYLSKLDPEVVRLSFSQMLKDGGYPTTPLVSREAFDKNFKLLAATQHPAAGTRYEDLMDTSFAEEAASKIPCN